MQRREKGVRRRENFVLGGHCKIDHLIPSYIVVPQKLKTLVTCSAILALLDKDDDLRARHELLNTEKIL